MDTIHLSDLFLWGCFFFCLVIWWHLSFNSIICRCNLLWWDKYTDWHWFCGFRDVTEVLFALLFVFFSLPGEERLFEGKVSLASKKIPTKMSFPWCHLYNWPWPKRGQINKLISLPPLSLWLLLFLFWQSSVPFIPIRQPWWNFRAECLSAWKIPLDENQWANYFT